MNRVIAFGKSDRGLKRPSNEDAFFVKAELGFHVLADGMGGAAAGELASQIFAVTALEVFSGLPPRESDHDVVLRLEKSYELANERILSHVRIHPDDRGMGCTAELLVILNNKFILGHVGDSRTYLYRRGKLKQLTRDHSLVQDQLDQGLITPMEARTHRLRHVILRAVGTNEALPVDLLRGEILQGDLFLLTSDGLTDMVEDRTIREVLALHVDISRKAERLIELAKAAGGHDNITVILSEVVA
jgi:protein phosphatase